jgi:hypothetical protein
MCLNPSLSVSILPISKLAILICDDNALSTINFEFDNFNLWPNPSNGSINISFNLDENNDVAIDIYDITGRLISRKNYKNASNNFDENINFRSIAKGFYIINIASGNKSTTKKIIIE